MTLLNSLQESFQPIWLRVKPWLSYYSNLAFPAKLAISAVISLVAGPEIVGFASEYATYHFALREGVRPPMEGIPYLKAAITTITFLLLFLSAITFVWFLLAATLCIRQLRRMITEPYEALDFPFELAGRLLGIDVRKLYTDIAKGVLTEFEQMPSKIAALAALVIGLAAGSAVALISYILGGSILWPGLSTAVGMSLSVLLIWRSQAAWWIAAAGALGICLTIIITLFDHYYYGKFLRYMRYGGGIPVVVEFDSTGENASDYAAYLVLRTSEALLLFDPDPGSTREIPLRAVKSLQHAAAPLDELPYALPSDGTSATKPVGGR